MISCSGWNNWRYVPVRTSSRGKQHKAVLSNPKQFSRVVEISLIYIKRKIKVVVRITAICYARWTCSLEYEIQIQNLPTTVGSKSTNTALGTCFPAPVSLKNVLNESSPPPIVLSLGIWPSGWMPCSRQYNSQQALPICTPAWPAWIEIHSRWKKAHFDTINVRLTEFKLEKLVHNPCTIPIQC